MWSNFLPSLFPILTCISPFAFYCFLQADRGGWRQRFTWCSGGAKKMPQVLAGAVLLPQGSLEHDSALNLVNLSASCGWLHFSCAAGADGAPRDESSPECWESSWGPGAGDSSPSAPSLTKGGRKAPPHWKLSKNLSCKAAVSCCPKAQALPEKAGCPVTPGTPCVHLPSWGAQFSFRNTQSDLNTAFSLDKVFQKPLSAFARSFSSVHATHHIRGCFQGSVWERPVIYLVGNLLGK